MKKRQMFWTYVLIVTVLACGTFAFGYACAHYSGPYFDEPKEQLVPTIREIQVMVGAEPDGIVGPNTLAKWDRVICDQEYIKSLELMRGGK